MSVSFDTVPNQKVIDATIKAMQERGFNAEFISDSQAALAKLKAFIPSGAEVVTGSSTTLNQIGFMDYLNSDQHDWKNLNAQIQSENDNEKRRELRRHANTAEYFVASVNAVTEDGQLVAVDLSGSRVGALPFSAQKVILVVGAQKIMPNLEEAMKRIREYVFPREDERAQAAYGAHSAFGKWLIIEREIIKDRINVLIVPENLGF